MPDEDRNAVSNDEVMAEYERFFAPIGPSLSNFSRRYNFFLEKYYHEAPCWSLCFSPPQGGFAKVDICRKSDDTVSIVGIWWVDDYDHGTRSLKRTAKEEVERDSALIEAGVIAKVKEVLTSKPGEWTQVATGYQELWSKTWTKRQFDQFQHSDQFPVPTLAAFL